jgi:hypothetical protein
MDVLYSIDDRSAANRAEFSRDLATCKRKVGPLQALLEQILSALSSWSSGELHHPLARRITRILSRRWMRKDSGAVFVSIACQLVQPTYHRRGSTEELKESLSGGETTEVSHSYAECSGK